MGSSFLEFNLDYVYPGFVSLLLMVLHLSSAMISKIINEGKIVPSEVTVELLQKAIVSSENDKFLIDGFPRNEENRLQYERIVSERCSFMTLLNGKPFSSFLIN